MRVSDYTGCATFPCADVLHSCCCAPAVDVDPQQITVFLISESAPSDPAEWYYAEGNPDFERTTVAAFNDAGIDIGSIPDILAMGVYLTAAVKCGKTGYGIRAATINECSGILEREINLFPNVKSFLLMGDVAIRSVNAIARRAGEGRVIPAGSTYKLRGLPYTFRGARAFPSYLQVGPAYGIEKSKRAMIAEDIAAAVRHAAGDRG